nr:L-serine ammonia-lyase, iron-sulfur-dependent, subunit alpha [uncultured Thiodictyon sp.]
MDRRDFLKLSAMAPVSGGLLLLPPGAGARGIAAEAIGGRPADLCYQLPSNGMVASTLKDLFKVGPGPSSSHTVAPIRIASNFRAAVAALPADQLARAQRIEVTLFGSLSVTGKGHRTDRAILAGLLGQQPETCDTALMDALQDTTQARTTQIAGKPFDVSGATILWDRGEHAFPYVNTLIMRLLAGDGSRIFEREYYSTGGGFYSWKGEPPPDRGQPVHRFGNMTELRQRATATGLPLHRIMLDNEQAIMGVGEQEVNDHLDLVIDTMNQGVAHGLTEEGLLPGPFAFYRKAKWINEKAGEATGAEAFIGELSSFALAIAEGNAAGRLAVTAPTLGSAGVMPAVIYMMNHRMQVPRAQLRQGLMAAGAVGLICKTNASVVGAEMGCQAEIGVASAMAAAMLASATGAPAQVTENAATIALEHHLGMTCDPVGDSS